jgi:hypothetical protein
LGIHKALIGKLHCQCEGRFKRSGHAPVIHAIPTPAKSAEESTCSRPRPRRVRNLTQGLSDGDDTQDR